MPIVAFFENVPQKRSYKPVFLIVLLQIISNFRIVYNLFILFGFSFQSRNTINNKQTIGTNYFHGTLIIIILYFIYLIISLFTCEFHEALTHLYNTKSWSIIFIIVMLTLSHINGHVITFIFSNKLNYFISILFLLVF